MLHLKTIATMHSDFPEKFGIPRQSNLVDGLISTIVFAPEYRNPDALRGLDAFSHIWLVWGFSEVIKQQRTDWSPTVRPPRLGGNARMGVFATRSPNRPNPLGLSSVKILEIHPQHPELGPIIQVQGADLMDGTPIYDIKPYIPYADSHPSALGGFASEAPRPGLRVQIDPAASAVLPPDAEALLCEVLAQDPRPPYQRDSERIYGMAFRDWELRFCVEEDTLIVLEVQKKGAE